MNIMMPGGLRRGTVDEKSMIYVQLSLCSNMYVCNKPFSTFAPVAQMSQHQQSGNQQCEAQKRQECRITSRFLPLKEMKTRGAASGSLRMGFPRAKPDRARRVWTVHRPSSCMFDRPPAAHAG